MSTAQKRKKIKKYLPIVGYIMAIFILSLFYYPESDSIYNGFIKEVFFGWVHGITALPNYLFGFIHDIRVIRPEEHSKIYFYAHFLGAVFFGFKSWDLFEKLSMSKD